MSSVIWIQVFLWGLVILSAVTGIAGTSSGGVIRRRETPRRFWYAWTATFLFAGFFSCMICWRVVFDLLGIR